MESRDESEWPDAGRERWLTASSLPEACELMARWFEARLRYRPVEGNALPTGGPTGGRLAAICRGGFLVRAYQDGIPLRDGFGQRQYVTGFCGVQQKDRLLAMSSATELVVVAHHPSSSNYASIPVVAGAAEPFPWLGRPESVGGEEDLRPWISEAGEAVAQAVHEAWFVEAFDPAWGRSDVLLPTTSDWLDGP
jgi:hypothetical protein